MAGEKIHINLNVDGKNYSTNIAPEKEEVYRRAAAEVNAYITKLRSKNVAERDCLPLTALQFAIDKIDLLRNREVGDEDMKALQNIDRRLDTYLNALDGNE